MTKRTWKQERQLHWRVVIDTSVMVSAAGWAAASRDVVNLWKTGYLQLLVTQEILAEYLDVLSRFLSFTQTAVWEGWFLRPELVTRIHSDLVRLQSVRDEKDNKFLDVAVAGRARYIISRDRDLTDMKEFRQVRIVTPEEFLDILARRQP